jgi:hypothetical protein
MSIRGLAPAVVLLLASTAGAAEEAFVGTVAAGGAAPRLNVTIREYTSDDVAFKMAERLLQAGQAAVVAELAKGDVGAVTIGDQKFRATMVRQQKTDKGRLVRIVLDRPVKTSATAPADTVGYLELTLGASGEGSGKVMTAVKAAFDADGFVVPESLGETWTVSGLKPGH